MSIITPSKPKIKKVLDEKRKQKEIQRYSATVSEFIPFFSSAVEYSYFLHQVNFILTETSLKGW
ncbi:MAG: hypothetical protein ACPL3Q_08840 [Candidatus Ratteibacteria bacterium]